MKLDDKKILDISYSILGIIFYYIKRIIKLFGIQNLSINNSKNKTNKSSIKKGLRYRRKINYFDVDLSSSGTTGEPTTVFASPLHWISEQSAQYEYFNKNGYRIFDRMILVRGYTPKKGQSIIK